MNIQMKELKYGDTVTLDGKEYTVKEIDCHGLTFTLTVKPKDEGKPFRWLFSPTAKVVIHTQDNYMGTIEVTSDYAKYLSEKPDGDWELRLAKMGDVIFRDYCNSHNVLADFIDLGSVDRGYRWCKPRPAISRYECRTADGIQYVWDNKGRCALCQCSQTQDSYRIARAMNEREAK